MGRRHGGKGAGRSPSMRLRIFRNSSLGTADWNVTYRPCRTTLAPILMSFSSGEVCDKCLTSPGGANVGFWLNPDILTGVAGHLLCPHNRTFKPRGRFATNSVRYTPNSGRLGQVFRMFSLVAIGCKLTLESHDP